MKSKHIPVMLNEVLEYLDPKPGEIFIDCTLGGAGYTIAIARKVRPNGKVLAIDMDEGAIERARNLMEKEKINNVILEHSNFKNLSTIARKHFGDEKINGIVFDLGLSSDQLADTERGFSFQIDAPLEMHFGSGAETLKTTEIVNQWSAKDLERIIKDYGEERFAKRIAENIVINRKENQITTTNQLVQIIENSIPKKFQGRIHPATKTFQALRMATNEELESLQTALPEAVDLLASQGVITVISFHSLEDRIVKHFFKDSSKTCVCPPKAPLCQCNTKPKIKILTRKLILPSDSEIKNNPRSRSAKLRAAEKI